MAKHPTRGFASLRIKDPKRMHEIASKGGKAAINRHKFKEGEEAKAMGSKGGKISHGGRGKNYGTTNSQET